MASTSAITSASDIQMDYMKLLVSQLQNQNPLEPLSNNEMASQLAQFSQLQQIENMNTSFSEVLATTNRSYATSLIGHEVSFIDPDSDGTGLARAVVSDVFNNVEGDIRLVAGDFSVGLDDIVSISN